MTDTKISDLTDGSPIQAADELVIARSGANKRVVMPTLDQIASINNVAGNVAMNSHKITGLADGTSETDAATLEQIPNAPVYASGKWYGGAASGNATQAANSMYMGPLLVPRSTSFQAIGVSCASSGGNIRLGVYGTDSTTGGPGALLLDAGQVSVTSSFRSITGLSLTLAAGLYWLAVATQAGGTPSIWFDGQPSKNWLFPVTQSTTVGVTGMRYVNASVSGALPNPAGVTAPQYSAAMAVQIQVT